MPTLTGTGSSVESGTAEAAKQAIGSARAALRGQTPQSGFVFA
jgi:hypothetical protein